VKLQSIEIEGFRRHFKTKIYCSEATFLIGPNNVGKSAVLKAIEYLLSDRQKMEDEDFCAILGDEGEKENLFEEVTLTAEFENIPTEAHTWKGFNKQRLFSYEPVDGADSGKKIIYRKTYYKGKNKNKIEMLQYAGTLKEEFSECKTIEDYINNGLDEGIVSSLFPDQPYTKKLTDAMLKELKDEGIEDVFTFNESETEWFENPGGIPGNVSHRLPKFLLISDKADTNELSGKSGALIKTLTQLFEDVRDRSDNFQNAQYYLEELAKELNPDDEESDFGELMNGLNRVLGEVFPQTSFLAQANLSEADNVIKPNFDIQLGSNINTPVDYQGAGVIRSAIFAMLRYRSLRENRLNGTEYTRPLLIAFEEPEIYLHPQAAKQMRDIIYELSMDGHNQIICTTHSPYMIDLSKDTNQILNALYLEEETIEYYGQEKSLDLVKANPFNVSKAYQDLIEDQQTQVKMLLKIDDSITKVFFSKNVLIIEGDTEEVVIRETLSRMPEDMHKEFSYNWEVVRARGKATIISLVNYLKSMGIYPYVIHDRDEGTERAYSFNEPILNAVGDENRVFLLKECMEDTLGYTPPSNNKPYRAYTFISAEWGGTWDQITPEWKYIIEALIRGNNRDDIASVEAASYLER